MAACSTWDRAGEDMNEVRVFCVCLFCLESCGWDWGRRIERERERERERGVPNKFNIVKSNGETHNSHVRKRANAKKS